MSPAVTTTTSVDDARDSVLAAADALFYERGIVAVPMADIRDRSGVSMRRLYSMYPHKSELVAGWLEHRHGTWMDTFAGGIEQRLIDGRNASEAVFGSLADWLVATDFRGCGFINTLAETSELTDRHREIIRTHKRALIELLSTFTSRPEALAVLIDGAIVQSAVFASIAPVDAARDVAAALFDSDTPGQD